MAHIICFGGFENNHDSFFCKNLRFYLYVFFVRDPGIGTETFVFEESVRKVVKNDTL